MRYGMTAASLACPYRTSFQRHFLPCQQYKWQGFRRRSSDLLDHSYTRGSAFQFLEGSDVWSLLCLKLPSVREIFREDGAIPTEMHLTRSIIFTVTIFDAVTSIFASGNISMYHNIHNYLSRFVTLTPQELEIFNESLERRIIPRRT